MCCKLKEKVSRESEKSSLKFNILRVSHPSNEASEEFMDAKYNYLIDNTAVRLTLIVAGFSLWLAASVGLLIVVFR